MGSLWGEEFKVERTQKETKDIIKKASKPKNSKTVTTTTLKSKKVSIGEKLKLIEENVNRILGVYKENTIVIRDLDTFIDYIDTAISNGVIAIDTETNNSLDPLTCKLMGLCIYTPGMKNAYVPINHVNSVTGEKLSWQLTEQDVYNQLSRVLSIKTLGHNAKFDYEVIKCTCGLAIPFYWDTLIGARILNENEKAGLKQQYIEKIDSSIEKYDIEHLFDIEYAVVPPEVFALYAATDSFMTYKLYEYQYKEFSKPGNENLFSLFMNVEMPVVEVLAEMELTGVCIDTEYAKRLSVKYNKKLEAVDREIKNELSKYNDKIATWRQTPEAIFKPTSKKPNKDGIYTLQKSKSEQLENPVNVSSPTQLAIFLYDILDVGVVDKKSPRGTGEDILNKIDLPICKLILKRRGLLKLINTYIDKLPECINSSTGRLHAKFNQVGADTGRQSSSEPNLQNIPSHENSIRMMFTSSEEIYNKDYTGYITLKHTEDLKTPRGWKNIKEVCIGDEVYVNDDTDLEVIAIISSIENKKDSYIVYFEEVVM